MTQLLGRFAALSMVGTVLLSLLPSGGMKRTAAFVLGLMTLMCWAEGVSALLNITLELPQPASMLSATGTSLEQTESAAIDVLGSPREESP